MNQLQSFAKLVSWISSHPRRCLAIFALILMTQIGPYWYAMPDSLPYLSMARSLAHGEGLRNLGREHWIYAPGYSVLVAPTFWISDRPFLALSATQWILAIIYMLGVYRWARQLRTGSEVWIAGLCVLSASFWVVCRQTLSDSAFMAILVWTAWCCAQMQSASSARTLLLWATPTLLGLAVLPIVRPAGVCLSAGFGVMMLWRAWTDRGAARWMVVGVASAMATLAILGLVLLILREQSTARANNAPTNFGGFLAQLRTFSETWLSSVRLRISDTGRVLIPGMFKAYSRRNSWLDPNLLVYVPITFVVVVGWARLVLRRADTLLLMAPFYVTLHLLWGLDQGARYLVPLLPVLWTAIWEFTSRWPKWRPAGATLLILAHLGVTLGYWVTKEIPRGQAMAEAEIVGDDIATRIRAAPGVVLCEPEAKMAGYWVSFVIDRPVEEYLVSSTTLDGVDWIIVGSKTAAPSGFQVVGEFGMYRLTERSVRAKAAP